MATEIKSFEFCGLPIRTVVLDADGWFLAQDVAALLEYDQTSNMTKRLDADEKRNYPLMNEAGNYANQTLINVVGFFKSIIYSKSKKSEYIIGFFLNEYLCGLFFDEIKKKEKLFVETRIDELYVVLFDHGVIKVGKGLNAFSRVKQHMANAAIFGNKVINFHVEKTPKMDEETLIKFCCSHGTLVNGNEYFKDLDFCSVVNFLKKGLKRRNLK